MKGLNVAMQKKDLLCCGQLYCESAPLEYAQGPPGQRQRFSLERSAFIRIESSNFGVLAVFVFIFVVYRFNKYFWQCAPGVTILI